MSNRPEFSFQKRNYSNTSLQNSSTKSKSTKMLHMHGKTAPHPFKTPIQKFQVNYN
jgi:hypothetical protein